jgi:hypothetical protein
MKQLFTRLNQRTAVLLASVSLLAAPILFVAPVAHASSFTFCDGNGYCWNMANASAPVKLLSTKNADSNISYQSDTLCGGQQFVTTSCPFADPSINAALAGSHQMVKFLFTLPNACADSNSAYSLVGGDCNGSHAAYVPVDNGFEYISVGASNQAYNAGSRYPNDVRYIQGGSGLSMTLSSSATVFIGTSY